MCSKEECYLVELGYAYFGKDKKKDEIVKKISRNRYMPYKLINIFKRERKEFGIFQTAYRYDTENLKEAFLYGDLYLDFDSADYNLVKDDVRTALSYLKIVFGLDHNNNEIKIFFSGNKGVHLIIPSEVLGIEPHKKLNMIFKEIAIAIKNFTRNKTIDTQIYDNKRLFRIENSIHEITNLRKIRLTFDEFCKYSFDDLKEVAKEKRYFEETKLSINKQANRMYEDFIKKAKENEGKIGENKKFKAKMNFIPECIKYILANGALSGTRNITSAILASFMKSYGKDLKTALKEIQDWNTTHNVPPSPESEITSTVLSIYNGSYNYGCKTIKDITGFSECKCKNKK